MIKSVRPSEAIRRAHQCLTVSFLASGATLTLPKIAVLRALLVAGPMTQKEITLAGAIDRSTASELFGRMATEGLIANVKIAESGRKMPVKSGPRPLLVTITPSGRRALEKADAAVLAAEAKMMQLVPSPDRQAFLRALRAIAEHRPVG